MRRLLTLAVAAAGTLGLAAAASAQSGQTITIMVGFGAGGSYHHTGVILSRHMPRHLPGNPTMIVKTMPGAGSIIASNFLANVAPKDGTMLGIIGGGVVLEPLFGNEKAKFDPREFGWIGSLSTGVNLCTVWADTGVKTVEDATKREVVAGSTGRGSRTYTYPVALNTILGTKFKIISGYKGLREMHPAMESGEIQSICGYTWEGLLSQKPDWVEDRKLNLIAQFARRKAPELEHVPLVQELVKNDKDRAAIDLLVVDTLIAWPLVAPPGIPAEMLDTYRKAFIDTLRDPEFLAEAKKTNRIVELVDGPEIDALMKETYATPPEIVAHARRISGME